MFRHEKIACLRGRRRADETIVMPANLVVNAFLTRYMLQSFVQ